MSNFPHLVIGARKGIKGDFQVKDTLYHDCLLDPSIGLMGNAADTACVRKEYTKD